MREEGRTVVATREPGGTELGERVRALLLDGGAVTPWAETALFAAARAQLVDDVIAPALRDGADVVCDRYLDSSLAYQGIARGLGVDAVLQLNLQVTRGLLPDRTFVFLIDPEEAARRSRAAPTGSSERGSSSRPGWTPPSGRSPRCSPSGSSCWTGCSRPPTWREWSAMSFDGFPEQLEARSAS